MGGRVHERGRRDDIDDARARDTRRRAPRRGARERQAPALAPAVVRVRSEVSAEGQGARTHDGGRSCRRGRGVEDARGSAKGRR